MGFSITGNILTGSAQRPDNKIYVHLEGKRKLIVAMDTSSLNKAGYVPGLNILSGSARTLLGVIHTVVHLAIAIFSSNRSHHLQEAKLGAENIARGLVELIPFITLITDAYQMLKFKKMAETNFNENFHAYRDDMVLYVDGVGVNKRALTEVHAELEKLNRKIAKADFEAIIPIPQKNN